MIVLLHGVTPVLMGSKQQHLILSFHQWPSNFFGVEIGRDV
jgi:hypothetical protein